MTEKEVLASLLGISCLAAIGSVAWTMGYLFVMGAPKRFVAYEQIAKGLFVAWCIVLSFFTALYVYLASIQRIFLHAVAHWLVASEFIVLLVLALFCSLKIFMGRKDPVPIRG